MGVLSGWFPFDDYRADIVDVDSDKTLYYVFHLETYFLPFVPERENHTRKAGICGKRVDKPFDY